MIADTHLRKKTTVYPQITNETQRVLQELEVHQIELEMQNAELRQARNELESSLEKYADLYDFAPVGYVTLDHKKIIQSVNLCGADILGLERAHVCLACVSFISLRMKLVNGFLNLSLWS